VEGRTRLLPLCDPTTGHLLPFPYSNPPPSSSSSSSHLIEDYLKGFVRVKAIRVGGQEYYFAELPEEGDKLSMVEESRLIRLRLLR